MLSSWLEWIRTQVLLGSGDANESDFVGLGVRELVGTAFVEECVARVNLRVVRSPSARRRMRSHGGKAFPDQRLDSGGIGARKKRTNPGTPGTQKYVLSFSLAGKAAGSPPWYSDRAEIRSDGPQNLGRVSGMFATGVVTGSVSGGVQESSARPSLPPSLPASSGTPRDVGLFFQTDSLNLQVTCSRREKRAQTRVHLCEGGH